MQKQLIERASSVTYMGLSYPRTGGLMVRERGMPPERIKGTPLGTMVGGGPLRNAIVLMLMLLFPRRAASS